jgi:hypothetical protein
MIKKTATIIQLIASVFIINLISACSAEQAANQPTCDQLCITMQNPQLKITLNTDVILVEQLYQMNINATQPIASMYIEGSNMNMGTLPLIYKLIENNKGNFVYQSSFMLGLCSQPEMTWILKVEMANDKTAEFNFVSYWQKPVQY